MEQVLNKMIKVINQQENKLLDQEGRSRRKNLRIYNVPEGAEGSAMVEFMEKLLRDTLEIPPTTSLDIERAHRALTLKPPGDREDKPCQSSSNSSATKPKKRLYAKLGERRCFSMGD